MSPERLATYLDAVHNDHAAALALYRWNSQLAAAFLHDLGHLEVALRNAYDRIICKKYPEWTKPGHEFLALEAGFQGSRHKQRERNRISIEALQRAGHEEHGMTHGRVIAELSFGFWSDLTLSCRSDTHWDPLLKNAFRVQDDTLRRGPVHDVIAKCKHFRNRCAHHEPIFMNRHSVETHIVAMSTLASLLSVQLSDWVRHHSEVPRLLEDQPVGASIDTESAGRYLDSSRNWFGH